MAPDPAKQLRALEQGERPAEEAGGGLGSRHGDPQGGGQGKLAESPEKWPERRRRTVDTVRRRLGPAKASERHVCRVLGQPRATQRYESKRAEQDKALLTEMRAIAAKRPCWGNPQVHEALHRRGHEVNYKRVERLWRENGMQVPRKLQKRRRLSLGGSENSCVRKRLECPNHIWSYDFVTDYTERGRQLRMLCVLDEFNC